METTTTIRFSERMSQLPPYLFGMINKMKMERRWKGEDVIDLGMGNPVDPAPNTVIGKLCEVAQDPKTHRYPIQIAGIVAMRDCEDDIANQVRLYQSRRDVMCDGLVRMDWPVDKPKAGMFVWVKIPQPWCRMGSVKFAVEMMQRANVAVTPGAGFGEEGDGHLRLALVENENRIRQGLKQMRRALGEFDKEVGIKRG